MGVQEDGTRTVSYSEISSFQRCEYQHFLNYRQGYRRQREQIGASATGIIVHVALAAALKWYHDNDYKQDLDAVLGVILSTVKTWSEEHRPEMPIVIDEEGMIVDFSDAVELWVKSVDEAAAIAYRTIVHLDVPNNWRTAVDPSGEPIIEYRLEYPMLKDVLYVGYVDWVAKDLRNGVTYVIDWKTRQKFQDDETSIISGEDFNVQLSLYQYALTRMDIPVSGAIIYQIFSGLPEIPELTQKGKVSRAKIKSDWLTYRQAVIDYGLDPEEYEDMRPQLDAIEFWRPVTHYRGEFELKSRWLEASRWAERVLEADNRPALKHENVMCRFCSFAQICLGEDKGYDVDHLIEERYTVKMDNTGEV